MEIDWSQAKSITLWEYDELINKLLDVLGYRFVQEHYNHSMALAPAYAERIQHGYLEGKETSLIGEMIEYFKQLDGLGINDYLDLVQRIKTKDKCAKFLQETGFGFVNLIQLLNFLFRWVLPFKCPVKELLDAIGYIDNVWVVILKENKIKSNLDVLENFRSKLGRATFCRETGMEERFILDLVHRADISRLAYVRGKTIRHLCGGGYDTLGKIASADPMKMENDMTAYYASIGKSFSDFRSVIPLGWMIGGARTVPAIVEG